MNSSYSTIQGDLLSLDGVRAVVLVASEPPWWAFWADDEKKSFELRVEYEDGDVFTYHYNNAEQAEAAREQFNTDLIERSGRWRDE